MNNQSTNDDENDKQQSISKQRPFRPELLKKIYYPDTLYPDGYTFFADRRSSPLQAPTMDTNDQNPTTDSQGTSRNTATIPKQATNEIEVIERQTKNIVSLDCI